MDPIINISEGKIKGYIRKNLNGESFYAFLGIPYGKPPVGSLRFKVSNENNFCYYFTKFLAFLQHSCSHIIQGSPFICRRTVTTILHK